VSAASVRRDGRVLYLEGAVNSTSSAVLYRQLASELEALTPTLDPGQPIRLECGAMDSCDSSAVALLLAAQRMAVAQNRQLVIGDVAGQLASLAELYGVAALIGADPTDRQDTPGNKSEIE